MADPAISVIVPVLDEQESIPILYRELTAVLTALARPYEVIFVNDGSTDNTGAILDSLADCDFTVTVIHFRRNFGQTAALMAGIDLARGDTLIPIDGDLQNDPADIPRLLKCLDTGFDVVSGWRRTRHDHPIFRTLPSRVANWLISAISGVPLHDYGCTLKAYRREVVTGVRLYGEMHRFIPIYAHMQGARLTELAVNHRPRQFGGTKYGLGRIGKVLLDLLLVKFLAAYGAKPIYLFGGFGFVCLVASLVPMALSVFYKVMPEGSGWHKDLVETPLPAIAAVLVLVGFLALLQGLVAEMLMRTYFESQNKNTYVVRRIHRGNDSEH